MLTLFKNICLLFFVLLNLGCTNSNHDEQGNTRMHASKASKIGSADAKDLRVLDGKVFQGSMRARGMLGFFSVKGTLSFQNSMLIWEAKGSKDIGAYQTIEHEDNIQFLAKLTIENNEQVEWSGFYDGVKLDQVQAIWSRKNGDLIHDLFLPERVILDFTIAQE